MKKKIIFVIALVIIIATVVVFTQISQKKVEPVIDIANWTAENIDQIFLDILPTLNGDKDYYRAKPLGEKQCHDVPALEGSETEPIGIPENTYECGSDDKNYNIGGGYYSTYSKYITIESVVGDFAVVGFILSRGIVGKENGKWSLIFDGQDLPSCNYLLNKNVPAQIGVDCYTDEGSMNFSDYYKGVRPKQ